MWWLCSEGWGPRQQRDEMTKTWASIHYSLLPDCICECKWDVTLDLMPYLHHDGLHLLHLWANYTFLKLSLSGILAQQISIDLGYHGFPVHSVGLPENRRHITWGFFLLGLHICGLQCLSLFYTGPPFPQFWVWLTFSAVLQNTTSTAIPGTPEARLSSACAPAPLAFLPTTEYQSLADILGGNIWDTDSAICIFMDAPSHTNCAIFPRLWRASGKISLC